MATVRSMKDIREKLSQQNISEVSLSIWSSNAYRKSWETFVWIKDSEMKYTEKRVIARYLTKFNSKKLGWKHMTARCVKKLQRACPQVCIRYIELNNEDVEPLVVDAAIMEAGLR